MRVGGRAGALLVAFAVALALPTAVWGHASLLATQPQASGVLAQPPTQVRLTYSERIEPRFAVISVTDASGKQVTAGSPARAADDEDAIVVPVHRLRQGWYLVWWRVISADGHPVRGAFTFAVGPSPGPPPQFVIPSLGESAATTKLVASRWVLLLGMLAALGLVAFRSVIARPLQVTGGSERGLRGVTTAAGIALAVALVAAPVYLVFATAEFSLRPWSDLGQIVPLVRDSGFGRAYFDLWIVLALFGIAALAAIAIDRATRSVRSAAELLATGAGLGAAGAVLVIPGIAGHASQTSPAALALALDWAHLVCGSVWIGGLLGLLVLWIGTPPGRRRAALTLVVPRFSAVAFVAVLLLLASGVAASYLHLPTLASLWETSYGKVILLKSAILAVTMLLGAVNLLVTRPRLAAAGIRADLAERAPALLRRLVASELVLVASAVLAASVLTSLPPPPKALANLGTASAKVGPGPVSKIVEAGSYRLDVRITPNRAALPNRFSVAISRDGVPLRGAEVTMRFTMLDMEEQQQIYTLPEGPAGTYSRLAPALVMVGRWGLGLTVTPKSGAPFDVLILDHASG
jgi:copper transport protein